MSRRFLITNNQDDDTMSIAAFDKHLDKAICKVQDSLDDYHEALSSRHLKGAQLPLYRFDVLHSDPLSDVVKLKDERDDHGSSLSSEKARHHIRIRDEMTLIMSTEGFDIPPTVYAGDTATLLFELDKIFGFGFITIEVALNQNIRLSRLMIDGDLTWVLRPGYLARVKDCKDFHGATVSLALIKALSDQESIEASAHLYDRSGGSTDLVVRTSKIPLNMSDMTVLAQLDNISKATRKYLEANSHELLSPSVISMITELALGDVEDTIRKAMNHVLVGPAIIEQNRQSYQEYFSAKFISEVITTQADILVRLK